MLINEKAAQPIRVQAIIRLGHQRDAFEITERGAIAESDTAALFYSYGQHF
jgi:hypothetical protein